MPGHATHLEPTVRSEDGNINASTPGTTPITILDVRVPRPDGHEALLRLEHQSGPAVAAIREQGAAFRAELLAELNEMAGGQAPPSVMALAELATGALVSLHMQRYMTMGSFGAWAESELDASANRMRESAEKSQRNLAGLAVVARDLLQSARAAAREAKAETAKTPTQQLMARLGHGGRPVDSVTGTITPRAESAKGPSSSPDQAPGGVATWDPSHPSSAPSSDSPNSEEPE